MSEFLKECHQLLTAYTLGEQPRVQNLIKLNTNESPFPPSPRAIAAVTADSLRALRLYSDISAADLVDAIASELNVRPENIVVGNGSDEILSWCFLAYGDQGAAFPDITYGFYEVWAALYGVHARVAPLRDDFTVDPADYAGARRMVVLANPNAPTGLALPPSAIEDIVRANPGNIVVIDEAYVDFGGQSCVPLIDRYDNLIVVQTFSKSRALAGGRLGFAVAQSRLIDDLNKMKFSLNPYNVNSLTQLVGAAAMRDRAYFDECRAKIIETREWTKEALTDLGFSVLDSRANFLFAAPAGIGGARVQQALRARNILVRRFDKPRIENHLRITIGTMADMRALVTAMREILS